MVHARYKGTVETVYLTRSRRLFYLPQKVGFSVISIDSLDKAKTVIRFYYVELLGRFDAGFKNKWLHLANKMVFSHHY